MKFKGNVRKMLCALRSDFQTPLTIVICFVSLSFGNPTRTCFRNITSGPTLIRLRAGFESRLRPYERMSSCVLGLLDIVR